MDCRWHSNGDRRQSRDRNSCRGLAGSILLVDVREYRKRMVVLAFAELSEPLDAERGVAGCSKVKCQKKSGGRDIENIPVAMIV